MNREDDKRRPARTGSGKRASLKRRKRKSVRPSGRELTAILAKMPPALHREFERLKSLLSTLNKNERVVCSELGVTICRVADDPVTYGKDASRQLAAVIGIDEKRLRMWGTVGARLDFLNKAHDVVADLARTFHVNGMARWERSLIQTGQNEELNKETERMIESLQELLALLVKQRQLLSLLQKPHRPSTPYLN